jgi:hypothetical protein
LYLTIDEVVFDTASTIHLIKNEKLLTAITETEYPIVVNGIHANATGVRINMEISARFITAKKGQQTSSLRQRWWMQQRKILYDEKADRFTVQMKDSKKIYSFCRKKIPGSESKFYVCNVNTMISNVPTSHPAEEEALVTVAENMKKYTKREVMGAMASRELLAKLGYPSVENASAMLRDGTGFTVAP